MENGCIFSFSVWSEWKAKIMVDTRTMSSWVQFSYSDVNEAWGSSAWLIRVRFVCHLFTFLYIGLHNMYTHGHLLWNVLNHSSHRVWPHPNWVHVYAVIGHAATAKWVALHRSPVHHGCDQLQRDELRWVEVRWDEMSEWTLLNVAYTLRTGRPFAGHR